MNRIAELRKKYGISQKDLAKDLNIAQNTLSQYENELRRPSVTISTRIADYFEVPISYLFGAAEEDTSPASDNSSLDICNTTKVTQTTDTGYANALMSFGWKLLHVGEYKSVGYDGSGLSDTLLTFGWYGNPLKAVLPNFDEDGSEHYEMEIPNTTLDD